jgi:peptide/nickel transport system ATP-binding protein
MTDLLTIRDLRISFQLHDALIEAVRGISFTVPPGGTVALVGESGSGKTVVSQAVLGILPNAGRIMGGEILFCDPNGPDVTIDLARLPRESTQYRQIRGGRISIIFQEPMTAHRT